MKFMTSCETQELINTRKDELYLNQLQTLLVAFFRYNHAFVFATDLHFKIYMGSCMGLLETGFLNTQSRIKNI